MKIIKVDAIPFRIPMRKVVKFATGQLASVDHVLVRVHTDEGLVGEAEAPSRPMVYGETPQSIVAAVSKWLGPSIIGLDPFAISAVWQAFDKMPQNPTAKGAIDIALHDIIGKATGISCRRLLGGYAQEIEVGHILGVGEPEAVAEQALQARSAYGFSNFKLKAGLDAKKDTAVIKSVREALGPDIRLYVDCNHGYDSMTAARTLAQWEPYDLAWVEEPCPGSDRLGRERVARDTALPLMADESAINPSEVMGEILRGHCRLISIKTARTGFTQSAAIRHLCDAAAMATVVGSQGDTDLGTVASLQFACADKSTARYPAELSFMLDIKGGLLTEPPHIEGGRMRTPDGPGLGLCIDEDKLKHFRMDI